MLDKKSIGKHQQGMTMGLDDKGGIRVSLPHFPRQRIKQSLDVDDLRAKQKSGLVEAFGE